MGRRGDYLHLASGGEDAEPRERDRRRLVFANPKRLIKARSSVVTHEAGDEAPLGRGALGSLYKSRNLERDRGGELL